MKRSTRDMLIGIAAMTATAAVFADPVVRPRPSHSEQDSVGTRAPSPFTPTGKSGHWVFTPNPLGLGLPWIRNFIEHPIEEPAPGEPGDVDGPG